MGEFRPGEVVQLNSGGPRMTVVKYLSNGEVDCEWFDEKKVAQRRSFAASSLKHAPDLGQRGQAGSRNPVTGY